tara:strand:- start:1948 stop:2625 length:678 start_codon:yes stop_codon:yes gene_type:complete
MKITQKIYIYDNKIKIKEKIILINFFAFLNNENSQKEILSIIKKKSFIILIIQTKNKLIENDTELTKKCLSIFKKNNLYCKKIIKNKKNIFLKKVTLSVEIVFFILIINLFFSYYINHSAKEMKSYNQKLTIQKIKLNQIKKKIKSKSLSNTEISNQIKTLNSLLNIPAILEEIIIDKNKISISLRSNQINYIEDFYKKKSIEKNIDIKLKKKNLNKLNISINKN